jgi:WD40 repeat protein
LLDSETGAEKLSIQTGKCWDVAISNRDTELAAISHDALLKRWKLPSGKPLPDLPLPSEGFGALAWSPDDRRIAYSNLNAIHIMELDAGEARVADVDPQTEIRQLTVSTDGRWIAAVEAPRSQRSIRVWERGNDGRFAMSQLGESTESTIGLKLTGDNSLISVSRKGSICEWNVESKAIARTIVETTAMDGAWFSSDGRRLAVTDQQRIQVFDLTTGREVVPPLAKRGYECMNLSPDGTSLIYTSGKGIDERPLKGHRVRNRMRNEIEARDSASRISMSPDGNWIVAEIEPSTFQSERSQVLVANRQTADVTARIDLPREWLLGTAISPDSNLLAGGTSLRAGPKNGHSVGGALWMWHSDGTQVARIPLDSAVTTLAFTADGRWLVTGQKDTTILVWDVAALKSSGR